MLNEKSVVYSNLRSLLQKNYKTNHWYKPSDFYSCDLYKGFAGNVTPNDVLEYLLSVSKKSTKINSEYLHGYIILTDFGIFTIHCYKNFDVYGILKHGRE